MSRSTKWKLAIVAGISKCLVYAEAKYCAFEIHGEPKYYVCPRTEYCCNLGCCVSPGFQIYHLWYYWLLVIIMFLVCSGGGWWYRYWLQGRYRAATSAIPTRTTSSRTQNSLRGPTCQAQQARISYNTARNTVLLHRMWKGTHARGASPATYSGAVAAGSGTHFQNTSVVLNDVSCPYYQLYGPPPSYETVIAQSRGKLSTPSSPELRCQPAAAGLAGPQQSQQAPQPQPAQCFYPAPQYQACPPPPRIDGFDTAEYVRLMQQQYDAPRVLATRQHYLEPSLRPVYDRSSLLSKSSDNSDDPELTIRQLLSPDDPDYLNPDLGGSSARSVVGVHRKPRRHRSKYDSASSSQSELLSEPTFDGCSTQQRRRIQGGSLKIPRRRDQYRQQQQQQQQYVQQKQLHDPSTASTSRSSEPPPQQQQQQQPTPSSNVISPTSNPQPASTNSNSESKRKLDRSRSLE